MASHDNTIPKPLYIVTQKVRFGGKRGICGFVVEYYTRGTLDKFPGLDYGFQASSFEDRLLWTKELIEAIIHISKSPVKFYCDLKLNNVALANLDDGDHIVLIDFDQHTRWYSWAPPEVNYVSYIERLAIGKVDLTVRERYTATLRTLIPDWKAVDRTSRYKNTEEGVSVAWQVLSVPEQEAAMVFMLGKMIWCTFEGVRNIPEPASYKSFHAADDEPVFPTFNKTPELLRHCIRDFTVGAPEWQDLRQPIFVRGGKMNSRVGSASEKSVKEAREELQAQIRSWWKGQVTKAERFINIFRSENTTEEDGTS